MKFSRTFAAEGLLERQGREQGATWGIAPRREPAQLRGKSRAKAAWWPWLLQDEGRHLPGGMGIKLSNASQQEAHREWQDAADSTLMGNFPSACLEIRSRVLRRFYSMAQEVAAASDTIEAPLVLSLTPWFLSSQVFSVALRFLSTPSFPEAQDRRSAVQPHAMKRWQICNAIMLIWCHTLCALFFKTPLWIEMWSLSPSHSTQCPPLGQVWNGFSTCGWFTVSLLHRVWNCCLCFVEHAWHSLGIFEVYF